MGTRPAKVDLLLGILGEMDGAVVAFSGGVDSALVLRAASEALGDRILAVTARSPAVPERELTEARELAGKIGIPLHVIDTDELDSPGYVANGPDRCYWCKSELFDRLEPIRRKEGLECIIDGTNADDLDDHRPGLRARAERGIRSPLIEAGLSKEDVREASRWWGLPTAEKPASPCLASRLPYGTKVTPEALAQVNAAEEVVRALGFRQFRVRHHEEVARLEIDPAELPRAMEPEVRHALVGGLKAAGYRWISLDLEGYRTGSLNEILPGPAGTSPRSGADPRGR